MDSLVRVSELQELADLYDQELEANLKRGANGSFTGLYPAHKKIPCTMPFLLVRVPTQKERIAEEERKVALQKMLREGAATLVAPVYLPTTHTQDLGFYMILRVRKAFGQKMRQVFRIRGVCQDGKASYRLVTLSPDRNRRFKLILKQLQVFNRRAYIMDPLPDVRVP